MLCSQNIGQCTVTPHVTIDNSILPIVPQTRDQVVGQNDYGRILARIAAQRIYDLALSLIYHYHVRYYCCLHILYYLWARGWQLAISIEKCCVLKILDNVQLLLTSLLITAYCLLYLRHVTR